MESNNASNTLNNGSGSESGAEPRQVRYVDPETKPRFRTSALPPNNSELITAEQEDRALFMQSMTIGILLIIIVLFLVWLEREKPVKIVIVTDLTISTFYKFNRSNWS